MGGRDGKERSKTAKGGKKELRRNSRKSINTVGSQLRLWRVDDSG